MKPYRHILVRLIALLGVLFVGTARPAGLEYALANGSATLTSTPPEVATSMTLGSTSQIAINLQNIGSTAVSPRLYEGHVSSGLASLMTAVPANLASVALPDQAQRIDPDLSAASATNPDQPTDFLVFLGDQADLSAAYTISDWNQRGMYVYQILHDHAERSQAGLRALLDARAVPYTPLWIVNALAVRGNAADMAALAARSEVALLRANHVAMIDHDLVASTSLNQPAGCSPDAANVCWNLVRIGADRVWANFGVRGAGITVANIDSGVSYTHPALVGQYRGNTGSGFNHNYNWFDPYLNSSAPVDSGDHGTHTMGTMVASGGANPSTPAVGVAPAARWIAARACGASECSDTALIQAAQWMLAPTDLNNLNPRPDLRPQVINNSWSSAGGNSWYAGYVAAWRAAGIFPVFSAGNNAYSAPNTRCSTISSPGDYAQVVGVGALDSANLLASYSQIGPSSDARLKPDITAPGSVVVSTSFSASYASKNGTSMAAPHVAGSVALLWSANPSLIGDYDQTYQLLAQNAVPISSDARFDGTAFSQCHVTSSPNNVYGYGRLDTYAATAAASVDVPWLGLPAGGVDPIAAGDSTSFEISIDTNRVPGPGTYQARILVHTSDLAQAPLSIPVSLTVETNSDYATVSGHLTRAADGSPLTGTVSVTGGASVSTDASGAYQIVLPPSPQEYTFTASSFDYIPQSVGMTLIASESRSQDFALQTDAPHLSFDAQLLSDTVELGPPRTLTFTLSNTGSKELTYSANLPAEQYGVWRSDQADGPAATWIDPPIDAVTLGLGDDGASSLIDLGFAFPFFGQSYTSAAISANGFLSFSALSSFGSYAIGCLPLSEPSGAAIIPLRVDLNPAQVGRVSYAYIGAGFLVSWEGVPLFSEPAQLLSFQVLLQPDGRVRFNYAQVGALKPAYLASAGLQQHSTSVESLGCGSSLSLSSGQTVELRPQPSTSFWATLANATGSIPPGGQVSLPLTLTWMRNPWSWPASADIIVQSNDPSIPRTTLTVRMTANPAPYNITLPIMFR